MRKDHANRAVPHRVAVLLLPPVIGYDATIPPQFLGAARGPAGERLYDVRMVSLDGRPAVTTSGYAITPDGDLDFLCEARTVIIPGTQFPGRDTGEPPAGLIAALAGLRQDARLVSICTGAFALALAGVLDGRRATTHWAHADALRALRPQVKVDEGVLFTDDGDVLTSAGLSAGADLCLHLIRRDHGTEAATMVARHCVVPPWRDGGQAQFIDRPVPAADGDTTAPARDWALAHLGEPIDMATLAHQAHMSLRTFNRRFSEETGCSPGAWLADQRLNHARRLLETTDLTVDRVAEASGLGTAANLRLRLRETLGVAPLAYRRTFRDRQAVQPRQPRPASHGSPSPAVTG